MAAAEAILKPRHEDALRILALNATANDLIREMAAETMYDLGRTDEAMQILRTLARDKQVGIWVRIAAARALGRLE